MNIRSFIVGLIFGGCFFMIAEVSVALDAEDKVLCEKMAVDKSNLYLLDIFELFMGNVTTTEVSILAKGKQVCFRGVATGRNDATNSTIATFEDRIFCKQTTDAERIAATKLRKTGYYVVGKFTGVSGNTISLNNCVFQQM